MYWRCSTITSPLTQRNGKESLPTWTSRHSWMVCQAPLWIPNVHRQHMPTQTTWWSKRKEMSDLWYIPMRQTGILSWSYPWCIWQFRTTITTYCGLLHTFIYMWPLCIHNGHSKYEPKIKIAWTHHKYGHINVGYNSGTTTIQHNEV